MKDPEDVRQLAPEWVDWLVDNFVEGASPADLREHMSGAGVPSHLTRQLLEELENSTVVRNLQRKLTARDQLFELALLRRQLETPSLESIIERRESVSGSEFFERYYAGNRPVILSDIASDWPALQLWRDPAYFADQFGGEMIDVCMGRETDPHCDRNFAQHTRRMTMRAYCEWVSATKESNDGYLISNNRLLENESFFRLLDDIVPPADYVDPERFRTFMSFWFGPAGTKTPLHHDGNNILFCQVVGKKEFYLVSPFETQLLHHAQGFYAPVSVPCDHGGEGLRPADEAFPHPAVRVELQQGEALFLPVGWWHQVRALEMSVSISFLNFRANNHFEWYAPGRKNQR